MVDATLYKLPGISKKRADKIAKLVRVVFRDPKALPNGSRS
jgi:hypothetical protein